MTVRFMRETSNDFQNIQRNKRKDYIYKTITICFIKQKSKNTGRTGKVINI